MTQPRQRPLLLPLVSGGLSILGLGGGLSCFIVLLPPEKDPGQAFRRLAQTQELMRPGLTPDFLTDSHPATCLLGAHCLNGNLALSPGVLPGTAGS